MYKDQTCSLFPDFLMELTLSLRELIMAIIHNSVLLWEALL